MRAAQMCQQVALVRGVLVKRIEAHPDQRARVELRQLLAQVGLCGDHHRRLCKRVASARA
jgi:hypothetical protein